MISLASPSIPCRAGLTCQAGGLEAEIRLLSVEGRGRSMARSFRQPLQAQSSKHITSFAARLCGGRWPDREKTTKFEENRVYVHVRGQPEARRLLILPAQDKTARRQCPVKDSKRTVNEYSFRHIFRYNERHYLRHIFGGGVRCIADVQIGGRRAGLLSELHFSRGSVVASVASVGFSAQEKCGSRCFRFSSKGRNTAMN